MRLPVGTAVGRGRDPGGASVAPRSKLCSGAAGLGAGRCKPARNLEMTYREVTIDEVKEDVGQVPRTIMTQLAQVKVAISR
jgi:hypothetical protein